MFRVYVSGYVTGYVPRYVSGYVSFGVCIEVCIEVCMGICIGVCIGEIKHAPFHEFPTCHVWKQPDTYVHVHIHTSKIL